MALTFEEGRIDHGERMMRRSAHVYILFSALANLLIGGYLTWREEPQFRRMQKVGSVFLLIAPAGFLAAFFIEPGPEVLHRPVSVVSAFCVLMGVILLVYGRLKEPDDRQPDAEQAAKS